MSPGPASTVLRFLRGGCGGCLCGRLCEPCRTGQDCEPSEATVERVTPGRVVLTDGRVFPTPGGAAPRPGQRVIVDCRPGLIASTPAHMPRRRDDEGTPFIPPPNSYDSPQRPEALALPLNGLTDPELWRLYPQGTGLNSVPFRGALFDDGTVDQRLRSYDHTARTTRRLDVQSGAAPDYAPESSPERPLTVFAPATQIRTPLATPQQPRPGLVLAPHIPNRDLFEIGRARLDGLLPPGLSAPDYIVPLHVGSVQPSTTTRTDHYGVALPEPYAQRPAPAPPRQDHPVAQQLQQAADLGVWLQDADDPEPVRVAVQWVRTATYASRTAYGPDDPTTVQGVRYLLAGTARGTVALHLYGPEFTVGDVLERVRGPFQSSTATLDFADPEVRTRLVTPEGGGPPYQEGVLLGPEITEWVFDDTALTVTDPPDLSGGEPRVRGPGGLFEVYVTGQEPDGQGNALAIRLRGTPVLTSTDRDTSWAALRGPEGVTFLSCTLATGAVTLWPDCQPGEAVALSAADFAKDILREPGAVPVGLLSHPGHHSYPLDRVAVVLRSPREDEQGHRLLPEARALVVWDAWRDATAEEWKKARLTRPRTYAKYLAYTAAKRPLPPAPPGGLTTAGPARALEVVES